MRWSGWYLLLMAAMLLFGISVTWAAGLAASVQLVLLTGAVALVAVAGWQSAHTTRVAVVGMRHGGRLRELETALDDAGFAPRRCLGPEHRPCPVLEDRPCPVRGHPAAAVVYVPSGQTGPLPPCGRGLDVPVLAVHEDPVWDRPGEDSQMSLPWERGSEAAGEAVRRLLVTPQCRAVA